MCEKDKIAYHGGSTQLNYGRCIEARSGPVCWMGSSGGSIDEGIQLNPSTRARPPTFLIRGLSLDPKLLLLFEDDCHYGNTEIGFYRAAVCVSLSTDRFTGYISISDEYALSSCIRSLPVFSRMLV